GRQQLEALFREVNRLRDYPNDKWGINEIEERNGQLSFSVRYLGDWMVPEDEEDDGDYDWKIPTPGTRKKLDALVAKYPGTEWWNEGEKCWLGFGLKKGVKVNEEVKTD